MTATAGPRRDLIYFLLGPALVALAVAALFYVHPWPTLPRTGQAEALGFGETLIYLTLGALGAMASRRVGCPPTPSVREPAKWRPILAWGLGVGAVYGAVDLALYVFVWGGHLQAVDHANGYTWANVALPWSLAHYLHGAIELECAFRLAVILIPTWLVGRVLLKGRFEPAVFWAFATLAALIEPLEKAIFLRKIPLADMGPMDIAMNVEAIVSQFLFAFLLRRFGWPAPILARYGYYLVVRIFGAYLFPHTSEMYPGVH